MSTQNSDDDDQNVDETPPTGPADHGRQGGMATRENAPEVTEPAENRDTDD